MKCAGRGEVQQNGYASIQQQETKENYASYEQQHTKLPLKLIMDPRGQVQDLATLRNQGVTLDSSGMLSPDRCAELVSALNAPKGKGL